MTPFELLYFIAPIAGWWAALSLAGFYILWVLYLAVMNLKRAQIAGQLTGKALFLGTPVLVLGYIIDFILNVFCMTIILMELPQETTVSSRLKRHNLESSGWGKAVAVWFEPLLDPYDPSGHHIS
jgi:hypothetical protein